MATTISLGNGHNMPLKMGKGPVKGAEASKGRISKDKGKSAGFGKKE